MVRGGREPHRVFREQFKIRPRILVDEEGAVGDMLDIYEPHSKLERRLLLLYGAQRLPDRQQGEAVLLLDPAAAPEGGPARRPSWESWRWRRTTTGPIDAAPPIVGGQVMSNDSPALAALLVLLTLVGAWSTRRRGADELLLGAAALLLLVAWGYPWPVVDSIREPRWQETAAFSVFCASGVLLLHPMLLPEALLPIRDRWRRPLLAASAALGFVHSGPWLALLIPVLCAWVVATLPLWAVFATLQRRASDRTRSEHPGR